MMEVIGMLHKVNSVKESIGYKVNSKVFETEAEARQFTKDLMAFGGLGGWSITSDPVTHRYLGNLLTEPIEGSCN